jgi:hypothetical protein
VRELVRRILFGYIVVALVAPKTARGIYRGIVSSSAGEIGAYESWQWCSPVDEDE